MKKVFSLYFFFLFSAPSYSTEVKPIVAVYPAWMHNNDYVKTIPWEGFSHLAITGIYPKEDGTLLTDGVDSFLPHLVAESHSNGKKVILSIGGAGSASKGFIEITKSDARMAKFIQNINDYVHKYHVDGIDIDWEYWTYQNELGRGGQDIAESNQLLSLIKALRKQFPPSFILTVDISPGDWVGEQYQVELQDYVNYVNLMAFDFTGAWGSSKIAYHSDLPTFDKAIDYVLKRGFNPSKVIVGLPAYGIEFLDGKNSKVRHLDYKEIVKILNEDQKKISRKRINNIYFEDQKSIKKKCLLVNKKKIAGIFIFNILSDHTSENFSLLKACNQIIQPESFAKAS